MRKLRNDFLNSMEETNAKVVNSKTTNMKKKGIDASLSNLVSDEAENGPNTWYRSEPDHYDIGDLLDNEHNLLDLDREINQLSDVVNDNEGDSSPLGENNEALEGLDEGQENLGASAPTSLGILEGDNIPEHIDELIAQNELDNAKEVPQEEIILPDNIAPPVHTTRTGRTTKTPAWANDYVFSYLLHGSW